MRSRPSIFAVVLALTITLLFAGSARAEAPQINTPATITGTAVVGQELEAHNGTWLYADGSSCQSECTMSYQWQRCSDGCADISGASKRFYTVQSADAGYTLRAMETMAKRDCGAWNNAAGTQECADITRSAPSGQTSVVPGGAAPTSPAAPTAPTGPKPQAPLPPTATAAPTVAGVPMVEQTLSATMGTWSGSPPLTIGLEWLRCDPEGGNCQGLGINASTYTIGFVDVGKTIRVKITAANLAGARGAVSDPTAVVSALMPTEQNPSIAVAKVTAPHRLVIDQVKAPARFTGKAMRVTLRVKDSRGFLVEGALVTASTLPGNALSRPAEFTTGADGLVTLEFKRGTKLRAVIKAVTVVVIARRPGDKPASPRGAIVRLKLPVAAAARR